MAMAIRFLFSSQTLNFIKPGYFCLRFISHESISRVQSLTCFQRRLWECPWRQTNCLSHVGNLAAVKTRRYYSTPGPVKTGNAPANEIQVNDSDGNVIGIMKYQKAESLAWQQGRKLLLVGKSAKPHQIFQLVAPEHYIEASKNLRAEKRAERIQDKTVRIKESISPNDLGIKIEHIVDWLQKGTVVKVQIKKKNGSDLKTQPKQFEEIVKATSQLAKVASVKHSLSEMQFQLQSKEVSKVSHEDKVQKPFTIDELKKMNASNAAASHESSKTSVDGENAIPPKHDSHKTKAAKSTKSPTEDRRTSEPKSTKRNQNESKGSAGKTTAKTEKVLAADSVKKG